MRDNPPRGNPGARYLAGDARQRDRAGSPRPHTRAKQERAAGPGRPTQGRAAGRGRAPDTRRPSQGREVLPPPGETSRHPRGERHPTGRARQRASAGYPHTRAHSKWAADPGCPPPGQAAGGGRAPDPRRPPTTPTARNAGLQERATLGHCWVPTPAPPAPSGNGQRGPAARPKDEQQQGERDCLRPDAPHNGESSPPGATSPYPRSA